MPPEKNISSLSYFSPLSSLFPFFICFMSFGISWPTSPY
uniref:Uncharacterized protein n=1 Tax=Rhizophora mucronata TaxID=61149 RepID=A0A2P2NRN3_RHIMU